MRKRKYDGFWMLEEKTVWRKKQKINENPETGNRQRQDVVIQ